MKMITEKNMTKNDNIINRKMGTKMITKLSFKQF